MTTYHDLLQAIRNEPHDEGLRLIAADWLEENGEAERAEFIRVEMELATRHRSFLWDQGTEAYLLERREHLWACHAGREWINHDPQLLLLAEGAYQYQLGFIDSLTCTSEQWLAAGDKALQVQPLRDVLLTTKLPVTWGRQRDTRKWEVSLRSGFRFARAVVSQGVPVEKALLQRLWPRVTFSICQQGARDD